MSKSFKRQTNSGEVSDHRSKVHLKHEMKHKERLVEEYLGDDQAEKYLNDPAVYRCLQEK